MENSESRKTMLKRAKGPITIPRAANTLYY